MALSSGGEIAVGLLLAVVAGIANGSWNTAFIPRFKLAVGRTADDEEEKEDDAIHDIAFHHSWILFQVYASIINTPICLYWAGGPERVHYILSNSSSTSLAAVVIFSVLWGVGSAGFGVACRVAGVGLGTNLMMGSIMVIGTFLPLLLEGTIATPSGGLILGGIVVCCAGLYFSMKSLQTRDNDEQKLKTERIMEDSTPVVENIVAVEAEGKREEDQPQYSTLQKVVVCLAAAVFGGLLQFAFVFGEELVELAEDNSKGPGRTPLSGTAATIWLLAIPLGAPASILYGIYTSPKHIPIRSMWTCPWYRHVLIVLTTSLPWISHIHLYGISNTLLPEELSASVAWPILMTLTVATGLIWSIGLGEWKDASIAAKRQLRTGLILIAVGVGQIMASVALS
jgi:hypothetical protein